MTLEKIGIVGFGVVGKAAERTFSKFYQTVVYDKYQDYDKFESLLSCDFVIIMVPTPFNCKENTVDDSALVSNLNRLNSLNFDKPVIVKSTLPPGKCELYSQKFNLEIVYNPEFLRESTTPYEDFENQDVIVIGTDSSSTFKLVKTMYEKVAIPDARYYHLTSKEAEMVKCAQNTMLASRVALANMIYDACKSNDIEYAKVKKIAFDNFEIIGPFMTQVPGPDGHRGFGGKCLPKDIRAFSTVHKSKLLDEIINYNDKLRDDLGKVLDDYEST